jgi:hypothetical protein
MRALIRLVLFFGLGVLLMPVAWLVLAMGSCGR